VAEINEINFTLFFTAGMSLKAWEDVGLLHREIAIYKRLLGHVSGVSFVTYGGPQDLELQEELCGIEILCNEADIPYEEYAGNLLDIHAKHLKEASIYQSNQLAGSIMAIEAARRFGGTAIVRCGYFPSEFHRLECGRDHRYDSLFSEESEALSSAHQVILTSDMARRFAVAAFGLSPEKITVIPNYVQTDLFKPSADVCSIPGRIVVPGRIVHQKNSLALVKALINYDCELVFLSDGELRTEVEKYVNQCGIRATFTGFVDHRCLPHIFRSAELAVLPSRFEGGPPKMLMEAMACGIPAIAGNSPGNRELIFDGHNGLLCGLDSKSIRKSVSLALENHSLRRKLGIRGMEFIRKMHSLDHIFQLYLNFLHEITQG